MGLLKSACLLSVLLSLGCGKQEPVTVSGTPSRAKTKDGLYIAWKEHRIDDEKMGTIPIRGADGLQMADLDKDGFLDIVSVHEDSNHIRLAFGSKLPNEWFRLTLGEGSDVAAAEDAAIGDLNRDGYPDVVAACEKGHLIYFQNPGGKVRGWPWKRVILPGTTGRGSFIRVFLADLNGDGRLEAIAANKGTGDGVNPISWFEIPADPLDGAAWREHELARVRTPINCPPVDLDGDGDMDVFGGSRGERKIFWFENLGGPSPSFRQHEILAADVNFSTEGFNVAFHDFSGDRRPDVVLATFARTIVWLEQPDEPSKQWRLHLVGTLAPDEPAGIALADINGDGASDVMAGGYSRGPRDKDGEKIGVADPVGRLTWFENPGSAPGVWQRHDILRLKRGMYDAFIPRDMDGDGDIDFVGTRGNSGEYDGVFWLEQMRTRNPQKSFTPARESESENLPLNVP